MRSFHLVASLALLVVCTHSAKLPPSFKKCQRRDDECIAAAISNVVPQLVKSYPEVGLPIGDPLDVPEIVIGSGTGPVDVGQHFQNVKIYGISKTKIISAKFDWEKKIFHVRATIPIVLKGDYELDGRILLLPIRGKGKSEVILQNTEIEATIPFEIIKKKRKDYIKLTDMKLTLKPELVKYDFENLFDGDKQLGENINKVLNENWNDIFQDVKVGYEKVFSSIVESLSNALFSRVPLDDIFLN